MDQIDRCQKAPAALALSQNDATNGMRQEGADGYGPSNIPGWFTTIEQDLLRLHTHPTGLSPLQRITMLADDAWHGVDTKGDGPIDAVARAGEPSPLTNKGRAWHP